MHLREYIPPNPERKLCERVSPVKSPIGSHVYHINKAIPFGDSNNIYLLG